MPCWHTGCVTSSSSSLPSSKDTCECLLQGNRHIGVLASSSLTAPGHVGTLVVLLHHHHHHHYHHLKRHVNVCYRVTGILEYLPQAALPPLAMLAHWLCYFNSSINPVIYNFMSCTYVLQSPFNPPPPLHGFMRVSCSHKKIIIFTSPQPLALSVLLL